MFSCFKIQSRRFIRTSATQSKLWEARRSLVSVLESNMPRLHVYDWVWELEQLLDHKSPSSVSLLEDTKPKTSTDFEITIKALEAGRNLVRVLESKMTRCPMYDPV